MKNANNKNDQNKPVIKNILAAANELVSYLQQTSCDEKIAVDDGHLEELAQYLDNIGNRLPGQSPAYLLVGQLRIYFVRPDDDGNPLSIARRRGNYSTECSVGEPELLVLARETTTVALSIG